MRGLNAKQTFQQKLGEKMVRKCSHAFDRIQGSTLLPFLYRTLHSSKAIKAFSIFFFSRYLLTNLFCISTRNGSAMCSFAVTCDFMNHSPCLAGGHVFIHNAMCSSQSMTLSARTGKWVIAWRWGTFMHP